MGNSINVTIFHQLGYFWKLIVIFRKYEVAKRKSNILGYFLPKQFVLHFHRNTQFQKWFVVSILRYQRGFDLEVVNFQAGF